MELATLKEKLTAAVKGRYYQIITSEYSITEQLNLIRTGGDATMDTFIDGKRSDEDAIATAIDALADTSILDDFTTGSDASMKTFVQGKMSLSNDEQRLVVAIALQSIR